jgi:hypothetical protein
LDGERDSLESAKFTRLNEEHGRKENRSHRRVSEVEQLDEVVIGNLLEEGAGGAEDLGWGFVAQKGGRPKDTEIGGAEVQTEGKGE